MKTLDDLLGPVDRFKDPTIVAAARWGVGKPYVNQVALDSPPLAPSNLVFLPIAIAHVGRTSDPEWGDWERTTLHYPTWPVRPKLDIFKLIKADESKAPKPPVPISISNRPGNFSHDSRQEALRQHEVAKAAWEAAAPERAEKHRQTVEEEKECFRQWEEGVTKHAGGAAALARSFDALARAVLDHKIEAYHRDVTGGKLQPLEPSVLTRSGLAPGAIREGIFEGHGARHFLFVDGEQLNRAFPTNAGASISSGGRATPIEDMSPYLQLAFHVALREAVGPNYRGKKSTLVEEIEAAMALFGLGDDDLGKTARKYLATFLRWPNARKGRAEREG